jgi:hypothetical protein
VNRGVDGGSCKSLKGMFIYQALPTSAVFSIIVVRSKQVMKKEVVRK